MGQLLNWKLNWIMEKILILVLTFHLANGGAGSSSSDRLTVWAEIGGRAELPCPAKPAMENDKAVLVLFYRDGRVEPVYTFDARNGDFSNGERWMDETVLGRRAFFKPLLEVPSLLLDPVVASDHGDFYCKVEYGKSATSKVYFKLSVIIPPGAPVITWNSRPVLGTVGPIMEDQPAELVCTSLGGRPPPSVTWWRDGVKISAREEVGVAGGGVVEVSSKLRVFGARDLARTPLKCQAHIHPRDHIILRPRVAEVLLNVTLPPLEVRITGGEHPVIAGTSVRLVCITSGSHPPATITWWKGGSLINGVTRTMADRGNVTTAAVMLSVTREDDGTIVTCRAKNDALPGPPLTDFLTLTVNFEPKVELRVRDDGTRLKEGEATELECVVSANPPAHLYAWFLNGVAVSQSPSVVVRANRLDLPSIKPEQAGRYTCKATNMLGATTSNALHITVLHTPRCAEGFGSRTELVSRGELATLTCKVDALPKSDLAFTWTRITKDGTEVLYPYQSKNDGLTSRIEITPRDVSDYQTLVCRAANSIGRQQEGCKIRLSPSGGPDPPHDCKGEPGGETGSLMVTCTEGFNGGRPQNFTLLAYQKNILIANMTTEQPVWGIGGLQRTEGVTLQISAFNERGSSDVVTLELPNIASTQQLQHRHRLLKQQDTVQTLLGAPSWLPAALGGIVATLVLLLIILLISVTIMHRRRRSTVKRRQDSVKNMVSSEGLNEDEQRIVTPSITDAEIIQASRDKGLHPDVLHMQMHSLSSTEASTPILDSGSRIRLDPCSGGGEILHCENYSETHHDCDSGRLIHAPLISQSACLKAEFIPTVSDTCSETDSENTVLCAPSLQSGASCSSKSQTPSGCSPIPPIVATSPSHSYHVFSPNSMHHNHHLHQYSLCSCKHVHPLQHVQHHPQFCRNHAGDASAIRLGSQEAEDSGLEDTAGSVENLAIQSCSHCMSQSSTPEPSRQFMSSPDISGAASTSLNRLHKHRLLHSMRRLHPRDYHHHPHHRYNCSGMMPQVDSQGRRVSCSHGRPPRMPSPHPQVENQSSPLLPGPTKGPKKPPRLPDFQESEGGLETNDSVDLETDNDRAVLTGRNSKRPMVINSTSGHRESAV